MENQQSIICKFCGKKFIPNKWKTGQYSVHQKYCQDCVTYNKLEKINICPVCNKSFVIKRKNINDHWPYQVYCSLSCAETVEVDVTCPVCNQTFKSGVTKDNKIKHKYCSENCARTVTKTKICKCCGKSFDCPSTIDGRFSRMYCNVCRPVEKQTKTKHTCQEKYGVDYPCLTKQCIDSNIQAKSKINEEFIKQLESNNVSVIPEKQLGNYYYDLFIPETKTLIEINPTVTHTIDSHIPQFKSKFLNYHLNKTNFALNAGFSCINVWDWDDISKVIQNILPNKHRLYARNLKIEEIDKQTANVFIDKYHLQNSCRNNTINLGLYNDNQLVQVMTFGKPRYNKNYQYELLRLCSHSNYIIIGGAEKLFKHFINNYNPESVISYCDVSKFNGSVYYRLCFKLLRQSIPQIIWNKPNSKEHITDNLLRQRGFDQLFGTNYGKGTDNKLLMLNHGWLPICDCGQKLFVWLRKESK